MPRLTRIRSTQLEDLASQQRFSPPRAILKQIARAEALALEIDTQQSYPEEWVVFRITGYRPAVPSAGGDSDYEATIIPGAALVGDLSAFVERLSNDAALGASSMSDPVISASELCERWKVGPKTLGRYRRQGLVARRARDDRGHVRLVFARGVVEAFEAQQSARIERAGAFNRLSPSVRARILRGAGLYAGRLGWTLNQASGRLALRYGVGHETVRQLLIKHDEGTDRPIFKRRPPLSVRERRVALRAYERGIPPQVIAARFGRTHASIHRVINLRRTERLRRVPLPSDREMAFELQGLEQSLLASPVVREGFGAPFPTDIESFVALARAMPPVDAVSEHARAAAMHFLWWRGTRVTRAALTGALRSTELDRAETDLRWMLRIKAELLRAELALIVRAAEERAGGDLLGLAPAEACGLLSLALAAAATAIDRHDPFRGGRIAAPVSLAISRELAPGAFRGTPPTGLADWSLRLTPWQSRFEPDARLRQRLLEAPVELRVPLGLRFGWGVDRIGGGGRPLTREEIQVQTGLVPQRQMVLLRAALRWVRHSEPPGGAS